MSGLIDNVQFTEMKDAFLQDVEQAENRIRVLESEQKTRQENSNETRDRMQQVRQLSQPSTLSRELVMLLVDRVVVEPKSAGEKCRKVMIEWNF